MKKSIIVATLAATLTSASAFALEEDLLMEVNKHPGMGGGPRFSLHCSIGQDGTRVAMYGQQTKVVFNETKYTDALPNFEAVQRVLKGAVEGSLQRTLGPTCGPSGSYVGIVGGPVVSQHVVLYNYGMSRVSNTAEGVADLIQFGNLNCQYPTAPQQ